ncbi:MAG: hypothetical protein JNL74_13650, partial [Fibrobacteres bacterium]|nr:hypothetical protein [Fibrobacterota bacterium]
DYSSADFKDKDMLSAFTGKKGEIAFVCDGDGTALRLAATLKKGYPSLLERSTIIGINGCPDLSPDDPRHATVRISMETIAEETVNTLNKMKRNGKITAGKILVDSNLIERTLELKR